MPKADPPSAEKGIIMDIAAFANAYSIVAAVLIVIAGLPQAWTIYRNKSSENVSLLMWVLLAFCIGGFLMRSLVIVKDPVFLIQQALSEAVNLFLIAEIVYFKKRSHAKKETDSA